MAYPTVDAPYGLVPVNLIGGQPYAGSTRQMKIASGYATNIFNGDVVIRRYQATMNHCFCGIHKQICRHGNGRAIIDGHRLGSRTDGKLSQSLSNQR